MPRLGKPTKPRNTKAIAAVAGGLLAFAVLGYLLVISPQKSKAAKLTTEIAAAQTQLQTTIAASHVAPQVDPRVDQLFRLTKAMPSSADMPGILLQLSRVADDTGISFDSITPAAPSSVGSFQEMPCSPQSTCVELSMMACWAAVGDGFSTVPPAVGSFDAPAGAEFEPPVPLPELEACLRRSPSPQNVSAKIINPNDTIDFIFDCLRNGIEKSGTFSTYS